MAIDTDIVARKYLAPVAGNTISVDIPASDKTTIKVYLSEVGELAVQDTDYTVALNTSTYEDFTIVPTASMRAKIDALVAAGGTDFIVVRRILGYLSDMTAELAFFRQKIATEFDKTIMRFQQVAEGLGRSLTFSEVDLGASGTLPPLSELEGRYLAVVNGSFVAAEGSTDTVISAAMGPVCSAATLAAGRTAFGLGTAATTNSTAYDAAGAAAAVLASSVQKTGETGEVNLTGASSVTVPTPLAGDTTSKAAAMANFAQGANGSSLVYLGSTTASNSASVEITDIAAGYDHYLLVFDKFVPATNAANLCIRVSTDNGSSWLSTGYNYNYRYSFSTGNSYATALGATFYQACSCSNLANTGVNGTIIAVGLGQNTGATVFSANLSANDNTNTSSSMTFSGGGAAYYSTGVANALRFYFSAGNITSGKVSIYGMRTA